MDKKTHRDIIGVKLSLGARMYFNELYNNIKERINRSRLKFFFNFTALGQLLNQKTSPSAWQFFSAYFSSYDWNRLRFRAYIQYLGHFDEILEGLTILKDFNIKLFDEYHTQAVVEHANPCDLARAFCYLDDAEILTPDNRQAIVDHANPVALAKALYRLNGTEFLAPNNRQAIVDYPNPLGLAIALNNLCQFGILTPENIQAVAAKSSSTALTNVLIHLHQAGVLTPNSCYAVIVDF